MSPHCFRVADNGSKVFDNNTNVEPFLYIEVIEVLSLQCHRRVYGLLQYFCSLLVMSIKDPRSHLCHAALSPYSL